jgi:exodeoxyribonuclease VII large subunit
VARKPFDPSAAAGGLFDAPKPDPAPEPAALTVAQAAAVVRDAAFGIGRVRVEGEIGSVATKKACFFTLKDPDADAVIDCIMWLSALARSEAQPAAGKRMVVEGRFDFWASGGRLRLVADRVALVGAGDLEARFQALCAELRGLGYFEESRKRRLPLMPRGVAIITASGSAALADCLKISEARLSSIPIRVVHVAVQGAGAAEEVARAIDAVNANAERLGVDVLVVTRGGGSREDLQPFNERVVADAAFRSRLPLVAAIGHESDVSVIELVADLRASTPTQAMVAVIPERQELLAQLDAVWSRLRALVRQGVQARAQHVRALASRACLRDPRALLIRPGDRVAHALLRLRHALARATADVRDRLRSLEARLHAKAPRQTVAVGQRRATDLSHRLALSVRSAMRGRADALRALAARLEAVAPERTLARGYSITLDERGQPVRDPSALSEGAMLTTRVERGSVRSRVERGG